MSEEKVETKESKKSMFTLKNLFYLIALILGLCGIDHYTTTLISGGSVTVTDSTIVVAAPAAVTLTTTVAVDSAKVDTIKK